MQGFLLGSLPQTLGSILRYYPWESQTNLLNRNIHWKYAWFSTKNNDRALKCLRCLPLPNPTWVKQSSWFYLFFFIAKRSLGKLWAQQRVSTNQYNQHQRLQPVPKTLPQLRATMNKVKRFYWADCFIIWSSEVLEPILVSFQYCCFKMKIFVVVIGLYFIIAYRPHWVFGSINLKFLSYPNISDWRTW